MGARRLGPRATSRACQLRGLALINLLAISAGSGSWLKCDGCKLALTALRPARGPAGKLAVDAAIPICERTNGTGQCHPTPSAGTWGCTDLCKGLMPLEAGTIEQLVEQFAPAEVCRMLGACPASPAPAPPPPTVRSNLSDSSGGARYPDWGRPSGSFVHVTDLHLQMGYAEGANTDCGEPICCWAGSPPGPADKRAGKFGDWACDLSPALATSMFETIGALEVAPDFVLNTGDDPAHDVWAQTEEANLEAIEFVSQLERNMSFGKPYRGRASVGQFVPSRPVVNTFGNHAPVPVNQFRGPGLDGWLYSGAAELWRPWLSDDAYRTLSYGGFYQLPVGPGLRAVVMHSTMFNGGFSGNWFFSVSQADVAGQFGWLEDVLTQARARREKVLLLRHCPISDFSGGFAERIKNVTASYSDVIVASFAGHSHTSWLTVLRDNSNTPVDVTYISGSGTPNGGNPAFRVYHYDLESFEILDYDQYWVDLDGSNAAGRPLWRLDHSAKQYYGLNDLSAASWDALARSWLGGSDNMTSWQRYARAMTRGHGNPAKQDRRVQACTVLSVTNELFQACMNNQTVAIPGQDSQLGSYLPKELAQILIAETTEP